MLNKGFSTVELLVAMAVLALTLSAAALLAFSGHALTADTPASAAALVYARELLQSEEALGQEDFNLLVPTTTMQTLGAETYTGQVSVNAVDTFTKKVSVAVSWSSSYGRSQSVLLTTLITDAKLSANSCDPVLSGDWSMLHSKNATTSFAQLVGDPSGAYILSDAVAYEGRLYVTQNNSSTNKETFFIFDISNPANPTLMSKLDNDPKHNSGLAGVAIASSSAGVYAYVASASSFSAGQLQVIDVHNSHAPVLVATYKIPTTTVPVAGLGKSIFYAEGYVYVGLAKSSGGDEFNIIDVSNPAHPAWVGGYAVGNDINSIYVKGNYAYIASPNSKNLLVLDISSPSAPTLAASYTPAGGSNGESLDVLGTTVYLGRTFGTNEFYVFDASTPAVVTLLGSIDLGVGSGTSVQGLVVRDYLAFLLTNAQVQMVRVDAPHMLATFGTPFNLPSGSGGSGVALACDGDNLYALSQFGTSGYLSVLHP